MEALLTLTGNIGTNIEYTSGESWAFARFRVATTPRIFRKGDWGDAETSWTAVKCTNRLAENVASSCSKGDPVIITGRLRTSSWMDASGQRHERMVLEATSVGHDMALGTTAFTRNERLRSEPPEEPTDWTGLENEDDSVDDQSA